MAKRDSKLQTLVRLLSHQEELAKRNLAARRQAVAGAAGKRDELAGMQQEYRNRLASAADTGVSAGNLRLWRHFNQSLDDVVDVQGLQVENLRRELEQAQQACRTALVRRRGGERLEAAEQRREAAVERRRERVESSDQAARRDYVDE